ncbi:UNVERIFIED_CONTAM: hypothetical protein FKN15_068612 [Acipenser sinensis]
MGPAECLHYNPSPQGLVYFYSYLLDLLSGTGFMELSSLFYGYYQNSEVGVSSQFSYNVPLAYLLTCLFYILLSLTWIVLRSGSGFKLAVVTGDGDLSSYSMSVFCGWDFGLEGEQAARLKQNSIRYELQVELEEDALRRNAASRTLAQSVYLYTLRGVLNLLVVGLILAAFYCIYRASEQSSILQCWETRIGQEMYKLMIFDFITGVVVILLVEFPRRMLVDHCSCKPLQLWGRQEFVVPENVLGLVYAQMVVWTGAFFCPFLPLINTVKFILLFYFKKWPATQSPETKFQDTKTVVLFFLLVLLLGLGLACVPLGYSVAVLVFSYMAAMASVYGNNVAQLKAQLKLEGRDKQFLVKRISELTPANQKKSAGPSGSVVDISETRELWE